MIERFKAEIAVESRDLLGEGPVWDASGNRLLWGDHAAHVLREARSNGADSWRETRRWNLKLPLAAAIPRGSGGLILVAGTEILTFDENLMNAVPQSKQAIKSFAQISASSDLIRFNDAKCDAKGRLWATTLSSDFKRDAAGLYRIDADGVTTEILAGLTLGNGMGWSPDSSVFYLVESFTREVLAFDFDLEHGCLGGRRVFVTLERAIPNGLSVDCLGNIWVASTGGGDVRCYSSGGQLLATVQIGTPGATSCCFGGSEGQHLFITSRAGRLPEAAKQMGVDPNMMDNNGPEAGGLFVCRVNVAGEPAHAFAG